MAIDESTNPDVKNYAQDVIKDSSKALQDVADWMNKKGVSQPPSLPDVKDEAIARLKGLSSGAVDYEFIALMAAEHQTVLARFRT